VKSSVAEAVPPSSSVNEAVNVYEPFARPVYEAPDCDPLSPKAVGGSHPPDDEVGPASAQTSDTVAFGILLYVNATLTAFVVSVAPSAGDGGTNVIAGDAAQATVTATRATRPANACNCRLAAPFRIDTPLSHGLTSVRGSGSSRCRRRGVS
jgi:hypothetical protein